MSISIEDLDRILDLCCLNVDLDKKVKYLSQLNNIVSYVSMLKEVDTDNIKGKEDFFMELSGGVSSFDQNGLLLDNVKHDMLNNGIVVKSAIK